MTVSRRVLVPLRDLELWSARGFVEVYRCPGGIRVDGDAVVMEWRPSRPGELPPVEV